MPYAIAKIYFLGNDDVNYQGLMLKEVKGVKAWQEEVQKILEDEFEENKFMTIHHSDNCGTIFDSPNEVMKTIQLMEIEQKTYEEMVKLIGTKFGHMPWFIQ